MKDYTNSDTYFAADEASQCVGFLERKAGYWFDSLLTNDYLDKIKRSWLSYHGVYYEDSHQINYGGETGELVNFAINHYRNIAQHILVMVTSNRPAFQPRSINTDHKSSVQVTLAHGLLEYYMRERRLERYLRTAVEYAIVLGSGYIKMGWNATSGEIYDYVEPMPLFEKNDAPDLQKDEDGNYIVDDEGNYLTIDGESLEALRDEQGNLVDKIGAILKGYPIYEGDVEFTNLSPYDVVFDSTKETTYEHDWVITRSFKNKYDLAAKYPELREKIIARKTKDQMQKHRVSLTPLDQTVDVPVYEFFHKRTEALPEGRYIVYLDDELILFDGPMPYRQLPVYRIAPSDILGTPYGYTSMFDLLPMQDAVNSLYSTVLTNQSTFGVQNILNPRGNDIKVNQLEGGLNFIEYNAQMGKPEAMNLTQTPAEIFNFLGMIERVMETVSGVNSVARGNADVSNLRSGNALALVQSQALQFMSGLQQSYIQLIEDVGTGLIQLLQDFAEVPRIAQIAGVSNKTKMQYFKGDDLRGINRVIVDAGNSLAQCLGKDTPVMMADGSIKNVQDIKVGDSVMGPDSLPRTVGNVNSGQEEMFRILPKNQKLDTAFECNRSHILTLRYCSDDHRYGVKKGQQIDISVDEYLKLPERQKRLLQSFTVGVDFPEKDLNVPPYILGAWLGDGTSQCTSITTMDSEILKEWCAYAETIDMDIRVVNTNNQSKTYFITSSKSSGKSDRNPMMNELRSMEVIGNKHIPYAYLINSRQNRLELLAGLIDTDGSLIDQTFIFTQKCEKLTDQVVFLAKSLGFRVVKTLEERTFNGKPADIYKVSIGGNTWEIPTRLPRKQPKEVQKIRNWNNFGITVESLGQGTYYGFTLIEEPHFVLGNFVVTHNTTAGRSEMAANLIQMGLIKTPEQYFSVLNTGKLEAMTEGPNNELLLIKAENERLVDGTKPVIAIDTDSHALHIAEHKNVLADPDARLDPKLVKRTLAHIQEHIDALRSVDPDLLALVHQQALQPPMTQPPQMPQNMSGQESTNMAETMANPEAQTTQPNLNLPSIAEPAQSPDGAPVLPNQIPLKS